MTVDAPAADADLIDEARNGSDRALIELLDRYRPMVRSRSRQYFLPGADRNDVTQEGMIGLYKAIRDFCPERGHEFGAFAQRCITRQIITAVRGAQRVKHAPLNTYVPLDGGPGEDRGGPVDDRWLAMDRDDPASRAIASSEADSLRRWCLSHLSELERDVLHHHLAGSTYLEISQKSGLPAKSVDNALQRVRRKMERHLAMADVEAPIAV